MTAVRKEVELTRGRVNDLWSAAAALEKSLDPLHRRFSYAVAYNQDVVEREVKAFEKATKKDEEYKTYDKARVDLAESHCHKDKDGNPIMRDNRYMMKNPAAFERELEELREQHSAYQKRQDFLEEKVPLELHVVKWRYVPEFLSVVYMKLFRCFIEYEEEEFECPSCGAELCIEDNKLKEIGEEEEEEVAEEAPPEEIPRKAPKKAKKRRKSA